MEKTVGGDRISKLMEANRGPRADRPKHEIVADAKAGAAIDHMLARNGAGARGGRECVAIASRECP